MNRTQAHGADNPRLHAGARRRGVGLALLCLILLGILPLLSARRPAEHDALAFAFLLSLWQLACSLPLLIYERRAAVRLVRTGATRAASARTVLLMLLTGVMFGLSTHLYVAAVDKAGPVSFAIAVQAYPLFAMAWEVIFLGRRRNPRELACIALLLGAMYYLGTGGTWRIDGLSSWFLLALAVPFLWSVAHVILKELLGATDITPNQVVFSRVLVSALFLGSVLLAVAGPEALAAAVLDGRVQRVALVMGCVYYLELLLWFHAVRTIDVSLASSITVPAPALTLLLGVVLFAEPVVAYQLVALTAVIMSLFGLMAAGSRHAPARASEPRATSAPGLPPP